jgi:hypothetical protein
MAFGGNVRRKLAQFNNISSERSFGSLIGTQTTVHELVNVGVKHGDGGRQNQDFWVPTQWDMVRFIDGNPPHLC